MHSHGGDKTNASPKKFWSTIGHPAIILALATAVTLSIMGCDATKQLLKPPLIKQEPAFWDYLVSIEEEKRANCDTPYFVLIGEVTKDIPIGMISVKRLTHPLKSPDVDALMDGTKFRLASPNIRRGQSDQFDIKVTLADTGKQITIGQATESLEDCAPVN